MAPASTTKLLTAMTVLEFLDADERLIAGAEQDFVASDARRCGVSRGGSYSVYDLLNGMLICSGNDAAYTLAYYAGKRASEREEMSDVHDFYENTRDDYYDESLDNVNISAADSGTAKKYIDVFVDYMNKNAQQMGCVDVNFETPDGYDSEGQLVTALDMARIGVMAKRNELISIICSTVSYKSNDFSESFITTNELMNEDGPYYNQYVDGLKTGSTGAAGKCFIASASKYNCNLVSAVLNSGPDGRWIDTYNLINVGFMYGDAYDEAEELVKE